MSRERRRFTFKRKGRYVLLGLALFAGYRSWQEPGVSAGAADQPALQQPQCRQPGTYTQAPRPPARLTGRLGLWVARLDPQTLQPLKVVAQDPDGLYPLASSYKQAVLWSLLRGVDAGEVRLDERFDVTTANQSLGNYPYDGSTVKVLAERMIHNSDNTATDILHRRVGLQGVQQLADELQLCRTRLLLPTKTWWVAQVGLDPGWPGAPAFAEASGEGRLQMATSLDAAAQTVRADRLQVALNRYFEERYDAQADLGTHNVSTPHEFGTLMAHQFMRSGLSANTDSLLRDVMATGYGRGRLNVPVRYFGGKGGNGWKILTMTGYLETQNGEHLVYVFMQHGSFEDYAIRNVGPAFQWINAGIAAALDRSTPELQARN